MSKRRATALALVVVGAAALGIGSGVDRLQAALAAQQQFQVASRTRLVSGRTEGEVVVGNDVVIRVRAAAGGLTAAERAQRVADRLQTLLNSGQVDANSFRVGVVNGEYAVLANNELIITADTYHAAVNGVTPQRLATIWRDNLASAVSQQVAGTRQEEERTTSKIVPIVSLGSGIRVGAARISGPAANVDQASVVGQIEATFQDVARIRIFVPLQSVTNINRVPQVNVTAYGDIRL